MKTAIEPDGQLFKDCCETDHASGTMRESPQNSFNFISQSAFVVLIARECGNIGTGCAAARHFRRPGSMLMGRGQDDQPPTGMPPLGCSTWPVM